MHGVRYGTISTALFLISSCTVTRPPEPTLSEVVSPPPPAPVERAWQGEKAQIAVRDFENKTGVTIPVSRTRKGTTPRNPIGLGMKEQIADTLMQTNAFIVQGHQVSSDGGEAQAVEVKEKGKKTIAGGKPEDVEFMLYGTVTAYTPSQASIPAGVEADPLLGVRSKGSGASSAFKILEQRAKESANVDQDRVAMDIQLVYARTKQEIGVTSFECNPQDWGDSLGGIFGNMLLTTSVQPQTPMQKAARACVIKVVNWVADKCLEARANPSLFAAPIEIPPDPKIRRIQKDLNTLGYDCGKEDGKRGVKTEACIAQFLQEARIEEPALEDELQKRLGQKPKEPEPKPKSLPVTPVATTSPPAASKSSPSEQPAGNQRPVATTPPPIAPSVPPVSNPEKEWGE